MIYNELIKDINDKLGDKYLIRFSDNIKEEIPENENNNIEALFSITGGTSDNAEGVSYQENTFILSFLVPSNSPIFKKEVYSELVAFVDAESGQIKQYGTDTQLQIVYNTPQINNNIIEGNINSFITITIDGSLLISKGLLSSNNLELYIGENLQEMELLNGHTSFIISIDTNLNSSKLTNENIVNKTLIGILRSFSIDLVCLKETQSILFDRVMNKALINKRFYFKAVYPDLYTITTRVILSSVSVNHALNTYCSLSVVLSEV